MLAYHNRNKSLARDQIKRINFNLSKMDSKKVYVLVIYTGGTIGMKESPDGND